MKCFLVELTGHNKRVLTASGPLGVFVTMKEMIRTDTHETKWCYEWALSYEFGPGAMWYENGRLMFIKPNMHFVDITDRIRAGKPPCITLDSTSLIWTMKDGVYEDL